MFCREKGQLPRSPLSDDETAFIDSMIVLKKMVQDQELPCTPATASLIHQLASMNKPLWAAVASISDSTKLQVCYKKKDSDCKRLLRR